MRIPAGYGVAAVAVVTTLALKFLVPFLGDPHPFVLLPVAILVAAWYGGFGPGIAATVASAIGTDVLFIYPPEIGVNTDVVGLLALVAEGVLITWITVALREARLRAKAEAYAADQARSEAALALNMREELMTLWTSKLRGPLSDFTTTVDEARIAHGGGDQERTGVALEQLRKNAALMRRTVNHWDERGLQPLDAGRDHKPAGD